MAKWRVMTVDDSAAILTIIAAYLEDSEFEVIAAERDGIMAVERFAQERPDIVLLDLIMPGQSGVSRDRRSGPRVSDIGCEEFSPETVHQG